MGSHIKFIACDMDGTLLNQHRQLPGDFADVFNALRAKNVLFAVASGRQYYSLKNTFRDFADDMLFIAENGTLVFYQDKEIYSCTIPKQEVAQIIGVLRLIANTHIVLCGKQSAYIESRDPKVQAEVSQYYHHLACVDDLLTVEDEFIKIAVLNFNGTEHYVYPDVAKHFASSHQVVVSAHIWLDVMHKTASKGDAIIHLRDIFDFTFEQSMSFGDYYNDAEMLAETYHSYAMENAAPAVKKLARFIAPSNDDNGVTEVIKNKILT
ncbi:Cof-type HAD-IIB family hydrolase [Thalassotalea maritima]|uniref:Cof-type HAD-IIB family hydrolase n=1 Tax=Thalassotalea maritima TaxID=3242416 RepID=UPI003527C89C